MKRTDEAAGPQPETSNPFASRWVRPGAVPYAFPPGIDARRLAARLAQNGWWGEIVGPHGSGKSCLLHTLLPAIQQAGRRVELHVLCAGQPPLPLRRSQTAQWGGDVQIVVDGYEQLARPRRWRLKRLCRRLGAGLLITAHRPAGLPELFRTCACLEIAQQVVRRLLPPGLVVIAPDDVARCHAKHNGNLRETLFDLYDLWEERAAR